MSLALLRRAALYCATTFALAWSTCGGQTLGSGETNHRGAIAELIIANHVLAKLELVDTYGHVTMRDPANPRRYLMARSMAPALVTDASLHAY